MSVMTTTASLLSDQTAYDRLAYFALRPENFFDRAADVKPTRQSMPGTSVKFTIYADLAVASSSIDESVDVDAVAMSDSQPEVTLEEYGNAVVTSAKLRGTSFLQVDADAANVVGQNAGISIDTLARDALAGGSNVRYSGQAVGRSTIIPTDVLSADNVRRALADLRGASAMTWEDGLFRAYVHPDVTYDLKRETGDASWNAPHMHTQPGEIWNGDIGTFQGFRFIETPRAPVLADAGSSTTLTDVYQTIFCGRQSLAKAFSSTVSAPLPQIVLGEVTDKLKRFRPIGWYWLGGYGRFREAAIRRYESASSIGSNA